MAAAVVVVATAVVVVATAAAVVVVATPKAVVVVATPKAVEGLLAATPKAEASSLHGQICPAASELFHSGARVFSLLDRSFFVSISTWQNIGFRV